MAQTPRASSRREGGAPARPVRRRADSADRAYGAIRRLVVDFRLKPDQRINEMQLARELTLSRTPIREALNRLATEGFLVFAPNRGFFFRSLDIDDLVRFFEVRSILERGSFALACARADEHQIAELDAYWRHALQRYRRRDPDEILELDEGFHLKLAQLSGNQEIVRQLAGINARIRFVRRVEIERGPRHDFMIDEHTQIVEALRRRAPEDGARLLASHISLSVEDARSALKEAIFKLYVNEQGSSVPPAA